MRVRVRVRVGVRVRVRVRVKVGVRIRLALTPTLNPNPDLQRLGGQAQLSSFGGLLEPTVRHLRRVEEVPPYISPISPLYLQVGNLHHVGVAQLPTLTLTLTLTLALALTRIM